MSEAGSTTQSGGFFGKLLAPFREFRDRERQRQNREQAEIRAASTPTSARSRRLRQRGTDRTKPYKELTSR